MRDIPVKNSITSKPYMGTEPVLFNMFPFFTFILEMKINKQRIIHTSKTFCYKLRKGSEITNNFRNL